jgi:glycosyltransferase involved in cell wall biosynthesis
MKILASRTITHDDNSWPEGIDVIDEVNYVESRFRRFSSKRRGLAQRWYEFQFGLHVLGRAHNYDGFALGRYGIWFPILQRLFRLKKRVVMMDTEWRSVGTGRINRAAAMASVKTCCFTNEEIKRYAHQSGIPIHKFGLALFAYQQRDQRQPSDEGYIFAGGFQGRDWDTFVKAVDGLPYPVRIYTNAELTYIPANVTKELSSPQVFFDKMAAASCVVVPIKPEPFRVTGCTTWANAMAMGKVVIAAEPLGAPDYMEQGVSGFYVNYGDVEALRACIEKVMGDAELRKRVGAAARERAHKEFSPEAFKRRILALLEGNDPGAPLGT